MIYSQIFFQSLKLAWANKYLWIFGLFASFLVLSESYDFIWRIALSQTIVFDLINLDWLDILINLKKAVLINWSILILIFLFILTLITLIFLTVIGQIALFEEAIKMEGWKRKITLKNWKTGFRDGISIGFKKFWSVLSLNLILKIFLFLFSFGLFISLFYLSNQVFGGFLKLFYLITFFFLFVLFLAGSFVLKYAIFFIVHKDIKVISALESGVKLLIQNWFESLKFGLIVLGVGIVFNLAFLFLLSLVYKPVMILIYFLVNFFAGNPENGALMANIILIINVLIGLVMIIANAFLTVFQVFSWGGFWLKINFKD